MSRKLAFTLLLCGALLWTSKASQAQTIFGRNLIVNGDAEAGPGDPDGRTPVASIPGWRLTGSPDVVEYASNFDIGPDKVKPLEAGKNYFYGGLRTANSTLTQTIDLSSGAAAIDAGTSTFAASAYLGGYEDEPESAQMGVTFLDASGRQLSSVTLGPVTDVDRGSVTGLWYRRSIGPVPIGARGASIILQMNWKSSNSNDAAADNLSLILSTPASPQTLLGRNLIVNGNAETPGVATDPQMITGAVVDVPGWSRTGLFSIDAYAEPDATLNSSTPGPPDRGNFYFFGGLSNSLSSATQDVDVASAATLIDAGNVKYSLSAWIGGYSDQEDNAVLTVQFRNFSGTVLGSATLGPVTAADRNRISALLQRNQNGGVPSGTKVIRITLTITRTDGLANDGMADSLALVLSGPAGAGSPAIAANGVVSAAAFGGFSSIAPGSWIEIYGSNLAATTRGWGGSDFNGANAPTSLDGVRVTVGGQAAFVDYVSPTQVNAQVPSNVGTGPQLLTVSNANGTSANYFITVNTVQPGLLAPPLFNISGRQYVVAIFPDGTFVAPQGSIPGVNSRPARPGETVTMYGVGFGPVSPNIPAGQIVGQVNSVSNPLSLLFGSTPATLPYKGLTPNFVGLYQFNVVVPAVANNLAVPLSFNLGGVAGTQTLYTAVSQ